MADNPRIRVPVDFPGAESAAALAARLVDLDAAGLEAAAALSRGEVSAKDYASGQRVAAAETRALETALRVIEEAYRATAQASAAASAQSGGSDLVHTSELEAMAIQHETEMLAHEERQLRATEAAQDHEIASLQQSITAREHVEAESAQVAAALAREAAARGGLTAAEQQEIASLDRSIAAQNLAEIEAQQVVNALSLEENAIYEAGRAAGYMTVEVSAAASAQGKLGTAVGATRNKLSNAQQSITAASFAFQDFTATSGDLGAKLNSISNNLPTLLIGLGGLGVGLSIAATAGIAVYKNWDSIASLWETRNPFPKAAVDVAGMKRELDAAKESLEKMEKAGSGNATQLEKYNELRATTARLETEIADQTERQARLKKLMEAPTEEAEGRAKGFDEATKGREQGTRDKIEAALDQAAQAELEAAWESRTAAVARVKAQNLSAAEEQRQMDSINAVYKQEKAAIEARIAESGKTAADLMERLHKGDEQAFHSLDLLMRGTGDLFGDLKAKMDEANPHIKKLVDDSIKELDEWFEEEQRGAKAKVKKEKDALAIEFKALDAWVDEEVKAARVEKTARDAAHKVRLEATKASADEAEKHWKDATAREKAEADRVLAAAGKGIEDLFRNLMVHSLLPAEKAAAAAVAQLAGQFRAGGARPGAANLAAREVAAKAGFQVAAPREFTGPAVPRPGTEAGKRIAAARKALKPEQDAIRKQLAAAARKAAPGLKKQKAAKLREARLARRPGHRPADDGGPGLRSVAPAPAPQANLAPAVAGTQTAMAATQQVQAANLAVVAALNLRVRQLEANARGLLTRATEAGPTASATGGNVA